MTVSSLDIERAPWLATEDQELAQQIRQLLATMTTISEAPTLRIAAPTSHSKPDSKEPGHVQYGDDGHPREDWSLHEHYRSRFVAARADFSRRIILAQGKVAVRSRRGLRGEDGVQPWTKAAEAARVALRLEADQNRDADDLVKDGEGVHAAEIAAESGWPIEWIRTVRIRRGREPEYGRVRPKWRELTDDERTALAKELHRGGMSVRSAAEFLGIGKSTVGPYWPRIRKVARAA